MGYSCEAIKQAENDAKLERANTPKYSDYYNPDEFDFADKTYKDNIKTVLFHPRNQPLAYPMIPLGSKFQLELTFDDLDGDVKNYSYTIVHCTANWEESDLSPFDYIEGFTEDSFDDYRYSFNTLQSYTQYRVYLPNQRMDFTKSGNYILKVFENSNQEEVILSKRFLVYEEKVIINSRVIAPNISRYLRTHQRLSFSFDYGMLGTLNPMTDIQVSILQNGRWDKAVHKLRPQFVRNKELVFDYSDQTLFKAGKEFRYFDFRNFSFNTEKVDKIWIEEETNTNQVKINRDEKRHTERYNYWKDMNGQFVIGRFGGFTRVDADYAWVHFSFEKEAPLDNGNVYVYGKFCDWEATDDNKMRYDYEDKSYKAKAYLKQGVYNYQYVVWEDGNEQIDDSILEGDYYETENNYIILIYFRPFNARYDQLVGFDILNSRN